MPANGANNGPAHMTKAIGRTIVRWKVLFRYLIDFSYNFSIGETVIVSRVFHHLTSSKYLDHTRMLTTHTMYPMTYTN